MPALVEEHVGGGGDDSRGGDGRHLRVVEEVPVAAAGVAAVGRVVPALQRPDVISQRKQVV